MTPVPSPKLGITVSVDGTPAWAPSIMATRVTARSIVVRIVAVELFERGEGKSVRAQIKKRPTPVKKRSSAWHSLVALCTPVFMHPSFGRSYGN